MCSFLSTHLSADQGGEGILRRGDKSIYGDNEAVYLVDGIQVSGVSAVNPCEMATIDILKDRGAAIYDSRAPIFFVSMLLNFKPA